MEHFSGNLELDIFKLKDCLIASQAIDLFHIEGILSHIQNVC